MLRFILCFTLMLCLSVAQAQDSPLSVDKIMQDADEWVGAQPEMPFWSESGETLYFWWNPEGQFPSDSLFKVPRTGGEPEKVAPEERRNLGPSFTGWHHGEHVYDEDYARKVYERDGDLYLYHRERDEAVRLTKTRDGISSPRFALDQEHVIYQSGMTLYRKHLDTGRTEQITDLRPGEDPEKEEEQSEQDAFLEEQQLDLFDTLRERREEREEREEAQEHDEEAEDLPPTFYVGDKSVQQLQLDPNERFVTFSLTKQPRERTPTELVDYVTESGHAEPFTSRPKVGNPPMEYEFFVQDLERDTTYQVDLHQLEGAYELLPFQVDDEAEVDSTEAERALQALGPYWSGDGSYAILDIHAYDNKDRWIVRLDAETGELSTLDRQHDEAWVAGPGISGWGGGTAGWLPDNRRFYFQSEATGYSHLYTVDVETGEVAQLTDGDFEVFDPMITRDGSQWVFLSSEDSPFVRHVYTMPIGGGERTQVTSAEGMAQYALHPDEDQLALRYSYINEPWDVYLADMDPGSGEMERVTDSPTEEWRAYDWREGELLWFEASDGVDVPAQLFEPEEPNDAAVLFVHGAGYLQNVHKGWSNYFREYMFHNMLTDLGYTVMNVDFRASAGYGRDWRTAVYRHMGGRDLEDYVDASRYLREEHGIDPENVFIYGGSYGGFITLMALFTEAEHFGGGAALRSVTDWAHYNHPYTANILNTPTADSLAYVRSSPIYHAEGLEDPLVMTHGLVDANVQPQDIFRLSQRLIELGKEDWELAIYPVEGHSFTEPSSWTDQYRRIFEWIERSVGPEAEAEARAETEADE